MSPKIKIMVQGFHPIFDDGGRPMSPGYVYTVKNTDSIQQYIQEGFATEVVVPEAPAKETDESIKKLSVTKNLKSQDTDSTQLQGAS